MNTAIATEQEEIDRLAKELEDLNNQIDQLKKDLEDAGVQIEDLNSRINDMDDLIAQRKADLAEKNAEFKKLSNLLK